MITAESVCPISWCGWVGSCSQPSEEASVWVAGGMGVTPGEVMAAWIGQNRSRQEAEIAEHLATHSSLEWVLALRTEQQKVVHATLRLSQMAKGQHVDPIDVLAELERIGDEMTDLRHRVGL